MYLAIIVLPLLGSIVSGFFGRKVGVIGAQMITCLCVTVTTILATIVFFEVGLTNISVSVQLFRWIDSESLNVLWGFQFDSLTVSMLIPVLIISSLVHLYSIGYMSNDPHNQRFFSYLSLFTFMMIILVTANNFLLMFVGWEGVGVCSYLLVSFWFTRIAANQSSISAFLTNRVGDCFLTIGMFVILWSFGNLDYATIFSVAPYISENIVTIIGICLLIGAMAKSSQIGLHVWLPLAMEGPTPVSALIHAATMVTAGVYLLMRTSPLIEYSSTVLILCLWIGAITTVFSSLIGLFQQDIKKVIAYSTMSQLGMMVIVIGLSSYNVALFHLINHAFYKGLLFLGAGAVIHAWADNQDFRKYGGLKIFLPLSYSVMLIASLSLVAFPFMTGFYSKDFILESSYGQFYFSSIVVYFVATIGAMFTTLYSVKVLYLTFLTNPNGPLINYKQAHEGDIFMSLPLIILAIFSIYFGYLSKDIFIGLGSDFFSDNSLFIHPAHEIMLDTEFAVASIFKLLPLILTILLSVISLLLSEYLPNLLIYFKFSKLGYNIFSFFNQRFLIELFYNKYITAFVFKLGGQTTKVLDKGSIELLGPYGLEKGLIFISNTITTLDTGVITSYALYILIGLIFYILIPYIFIEDSNLLLLTLFALLTIALSNNYINNNYTILSNNKTSSFLIVKESCLLNFNKNELIKTLPSRKEVIEKYLPKLNPKNYKFNLVKLNPISDDWLLIDSTYLDFHKKRQQILEKFKPQVFKCLDGTDTACKEVFNLIVKYLIKVYSDYFVIIEKENNKIIYNKLTKEFFHLNTNTPLEDACRLIMEDLNILIKNDKGTYILVASATMFPVGWAVNERIGYNLKQLHPNVPQWDGQLKNIVANIFDKKIVGDTVHTRYGIFVQNTPELFQPRPLNLRKPLESEIENVEGFRFKDIHIRRERQNFIRLLQSDAILFTVRTFVDSIIDLQKKELIGFHTMVSNWDNNTKKYKEVFSWGPVLDKYLQQTISKNSYNCN